MLIALTGLQGASLVAGLGLVAYLVASHVFGFDFRKAGAEPVGKDGPLLGPLKAAQAEIAAEEKRKADFDAKSDAKVAAKKKELADAAALIAGAVSPDAVPGAAT